MCLLCGGSRAVPLPAATAYRSISRYTLVMPHSSSVSVCGQSDKMKPLFVKCNYFKFVFLCVHKDGDPRCNNTFGDCQCSQCRGRGDSAGYANGGTKRLYLHPIHQRSVDVFCRITAAVLSVRQYLHYDCHTHKVHVFCTSDAVVPFVLCNTQQRRSQTLDFTLDEKP